MLVLGWGGGTPYNGLYGEVYERRNFSVGLDIGGIVHRRVINLYTGVERGTVRVKCLTQEQNTMSRWPELEPQPLDLDSTALTTPSDHFGYPT